MNQMSSNIKRSLRIMSCDVHILFSSKSKQTQKLHYTIQIWFDQTSRTIFHVSSDLNSSLESLFEERFDDNEMLNAIEPIPSTFSYLKIMSQGSLQRSSLDIFHLTHLMPDKFSFGCQNLQYHRQDQTGASGRSSHQTREAC